MAKTSNECVCNMMTFQPFIERIRRFDYYLRMFYFINFIRVLIIELNTTKSILAKVETVK